MEKGKRQKIKLGSDCDSCTIFGCDRTEAEKAKCCRLNKHEFSVIKCSDCGEVFCWNCATDHGITEDNNRKLWLTCWNCGEINIKENKNA